MNILGINCYHADSSATILIDGKIVAASEEERFSRIKHMKGFPVNSIDFCLNRAKLNIDKIDIIAINFNGTYNFKEKLYFLLLNFFRFRTWKNKIKKFKSFTSILDTFYNYYGITNKIKIINVSHHLAHAASSVFVSGLKDGISISLDGSGDFSTGEVYTFSNRSFKLKKKINFPHSIGIFYQAITQYLGFKDYGDEYKVMGLAASGKPIYFDKLKNVLKYDNGNLKLNLNYFRHHKYLDESTLTDLNVPELFSKKLIKLLGKPRKKKSKILKKHKDIASSLQKIFETRVLEYVSYYQNKYKLNNLFLSGGSFLNSLSNMNLINKTKFKKIFIQPNAGDAGGSLGAALYASNKFDKKFKNIRLQNIYLGFKDKNKVVKEMIDFYFKNNKKFKVRKFLSMTDVVSIISKELSNSKIIAWHQNSAEFGPRALGNRSILADPRELKIKNMINKKIKNRDSFRPFAPSVIDKFAKEYFNISEKFDYYYMNATVKVKKNMEKCIPAVVNFDNTARIQIVKKKMNLNYYRLIESFYKITKIPILLNTSLNIEEPIANSCEDSIKTFLNSKIDHLVINKYIISRKQ